jgi:MFS family permease
MQQSDTYSAIEPPDAVNQQRWWILAACCTIAFAQQAEPYLWMIGVEIPASAFGTAWREYRFLANLGVVLFVACQLIGGVLGDLYGRRRILLIGAVGATVANIVSLLAWNIPSLIVARGIVGVLGALAFPLALAIIRLVFVGDERKIALLIYTFFTALGVLAALLAIPIEGWFGWRWALLLPIVSGLVGVQLARRYVPESRARTGLRRFEAMTTAAWSLGFLAMIFGVAAAQSSNSWLNPITIGAGIVCALSLGLLAYWLNNKSPGYLATPSGVLPRSFLSLVLFITAALSFTLSGFVLQLYQYFFTVRVWTGFISGIALAPILLGNIFTMRWAARVAIEQPRGVVIGGGLAAMAVAILLTALAGPTTPYLLLVPPMVLYGLGFLLASTAWTHFFFGALPSDLIGLNAGINRSAALVGGGVAGVVLSAIVQGVGMADFTRRLGDLGLDTAQQQQALEELEAVLQLRGVPDAQAQIPDELVTLGLLATYRESFSVGITYALLVIAVLCVVCSALAWFWFIRGNLAAKYQDSGIRSQEA